MEQAAQEAGGQRIFVARLTVGLAQGLALYLLYYAHDNKSWPATDPNLFAPSLLVFLFVPLLVLQGMGNLRKRTLIVWTVLATAVAAGFAWYDVWHAWPTDLHWANGAQVAVAHVTPSPRVLVFTAVFLFVAHTLISCSEADRRLVPRYATLFDLAWKLGVQLAIAAAFVATFWIILWLGVALFEMIKLHFFKTFIRHSWFAIPVTALATAVAIHITDTRGNLVRGVRTLALMLLGWLLPVIALIAFAFLISLVFTGLKPLWETRTATALLLVASAVLVIHINAAYQDGDPERRPHHALRVAGTLACVMLIFIVTIAAYALWLRVDQYGWTVDRIDTAAVTLVAICFAVGYFIAALLPTPWLKLIEGWNYLTTILGLAILFALFTPLADPVRLSVASQMERLKSGKVKIEAFDFNYLRWEGGRFGRDALTELGKSKDSHVREAALAALKQANRYTIVGSRKASPEETAAAITVYPKGRTLPASFLRQDWKGTDAAGFPCLFGTDRCDAIITDLDGDSVDEVVLVTRLGSGSWAQIGEFKQDGKVWRLIGARYGFVCAGDREALIAGQFKAATPEERDILVGAKRLRVTPPNNTDIPCK
ncbi:MAG: DUF4153 domain-containing protein [Alphaproteobacteria bacterium]|nr:DUF4153 domain-containing protein [Alphaproteobacteria bacterium]MDE2630129.1 DUF4153 domain-containing protein [Alphaproteobacteria bacterium]